MTTVFETTNIFRQQDFALAFIPAVSDGVSLEWEQVLFLFIMSTYYEKLRSPQWQRKRLEIMERDDFTCRSCGSTDNPLNVHHKTYRKNTDPWDYDDKNFITYCEDCHGKWHEEKDFLLMNVDSEEKMRRLATIAYHCKANEISLGQLICVFSAIENGRIFNKEELKLELAKATHMLELCKTFIKYAKKRIKDS